jgi:hypothetical protein
MKFFLGKAGKKERLVSQAKRLILFGDDFQDIVQFAVMSGKYLAATSCPYLNLKSKNIELTVDIKGHDTPQRNAYDIFEKTTVSLPNTCVEAAEHALKCMFKGSHSGGRIKDGDGAEISMQLGDSVKYDIDQEDMNEKSFKFFGGKGSAADAKTELFRPGEGMALVFSKSESSRKEGEWKVHALAIVLVSQDPFDQFMIVEEEFSADEENKKVKMGKSWKLATKYKLWKLTAS